MARGIAGARGLRMLPHTRVECRGSGGFGKNGDGIFHPEAVVAGVVAVAREHAFVRGVVPRCAVGLREPVGDGGRNCGGNRVRMIYPPLVLAARRRGGEGVPAPWREALPELVGLRMLPPHARGASRKWRPRQERRGDVSSRGGCCRGYCRCKRARARSRRCPTKHRGVAGARARPWPKPWRELGKDDRSLLGYCRLMRGNAAWRC
jgi:hypothetical protein